MTLKSLVITAVLCALAPLGEAADSVHIQIFRAGKQIQKTPKPNFVPNIIALLESCSVHSTAYAVTNTAWTNLTQSPSFVRITFTPARDFQVMMSPGLGARERIATELQQILVPLPENTWPAHIYARAGDRVYSFTKYNPIALKHLILEPALDLKSTKPYSDLLTLPEK